MPGSNSYLTMLHDTRVASHAKLWPHNSTDMNKQCPKISSNSKLHILRFNPCLHMGSVLSLDAQGEDFLLPRLSHNRATHSPHRAQKASASSFIQFGRDPAWALHLPKAASSGYMKANSTSHGKTLKSSCCQPP